ncbi:hypothetical protein QTP70_006726, partial [Hemibagrus guttatus]
MGKCKDLSEFDKDQIVMARRLDQSISKTAALVGSSRSAVVSIYQKYPFSPWFVSALCSSAASLSAWPPPPPPPFSFPGNESMSDKPVCVTFERFCIVTWCLFFVLTFLVMLIHFIQFHNLLPLSWKNLTATVAALGALMTLFASFAFTWNLVNQQSGNHDPKSIAAAVGSYLTSLAYSKELHLIRSQNDGQQRGYMATIPGLLKVLQVFGGCIALVLLNTIHDKLEWRTNVSFVTYSVCLLPTIGTVLVMVLDCAARSPVPFDRLLASFSLLGVIMYTINTVICFTRALEQ